MSPFAAQARSATQQLGILENTGKPSQASFFQLCIVELIIVPIGEGFWDGGSVARRYSALHWHGNVFRKCQLSKYHMS